MNKELLRDLQGDTGRLKAAFKILDETEQSFAKYDLDTPAMRVLREQTLKVVNLVASCRTTASGMLQALEMIAASEDLFDAHRFDDEKVNDAGLTEYEALDREENV